ncbi:hypothetical protein FHS15_005020 [Paenibacillus castaneae]|uniref:hypothetical protein n=1 Tax=Paenibacillus castaneae TaxID=474957 RepID=UPI000C9B4BAA|nr:hypothetical protein [Paenibacillus castaneae]NIK79853.1 hypothetical protein [Paenibacillus castaneae]
MQKCSTWSSERQPSGECDAEVMQKCSTWSSERQPGGPEGLYDDDLRDQNKAKSFRNPLKSRNRKLFLRL